MGKVKKQKRHLKFNYNKDRKKNWKKAKQIPEISCDQVKTAWDMNKSVKKNLEEMGISADPNKTLKIPRSKPMKMGTLDIEMEVDLEKTPIKKFVIQDLEKQSQIPGKQKMSMSEEDAGFCAYLIDKYGDNFKGMARDERNYYQETPKQLQRKINRFKSIPKVYDPYLASKKEVSTTIDHHHHMTSLSPYHCPPLASLSFPLTSLSPTTCPPLTSPTCPPLTSSSLPDRPPLTSSLPNRPPLASLSPHRYLTRWSEACRRNGHFISPGLFNTAPAVYAPHATLCRVRRRLQFGRKPPKERDAHDT